MNACHGLLVMLNQVKNGSRRFHQILFYTRVLLRKTGTTCRPHNLETRVIAILFPSICAPHRGIIGGHK